MAEQMAGAFPVPSNDAVRLTQLRNQGRRVRTVSNSLMAALGGTGILPGREREAHQVLQGLRARARAGDAGASEDMVDLTVFFAQELSDTTQIEELRALTEATLRASVVLRHRQEQLGRLCRLAVRQGNRVAALEALAQMAIDPPDLESDSELRFSAATLATLEGEGQRVLSLLGEHPDEIPFDACFVMPATVLRANALELLGQTEQAASVLQTLPQASLLAELRETYPSLGLCSRSAQIYVARQSAARASWPRQRGTGFGKGILFAVMGGGVLLALTQADAQSSRSSFIFFLGLGIVMLAGGLVFVRRGIKQGRHVAFLRAHGLSLTGVVVQTEGQSWEDDEDVHCLRLDVAGPEGTYRVSVKKYNDVQVVLGQSMQILAHPDDLTDVILDEAQLV